MAHDPTRSPDDQKRAKGRFWTINAMRIGGVLMILAGIAIYRGVLPLPAFLAYIFIALGAIEAFVAPRLLARMWSTRNNMPPRQ